MSSEIRNEYVPDHVSAPGETLIEILEDVGMTQAELAKRTGRTTKTINGIVKGREPLTPATALQFEKVLGVNARFWNELERNYAEFKAREAEARQQAEAVSWLSCLPISEMKKRAWLPRTTDKVTLVDAALRFFGVASVREWESVSLSSQFAYRKSDKVSTKTGHVATWLRAGELEAQGISSAPYDRDRFRDVLQKLRLLTTTTPDVFTPAIVERCATAGVAVVFVREIAGAPISGATRWLNKDKAMIQLSLRYKTNDQLWFSLFHEAGLILLHRKKDVFLEFNGSQETDQERAADAFARDHLIPPDAFAEFKGHSRFSGAAVEEFASRVGIHPGIVVGRLQHEGLLEYSHLNGLKMKLKWAN